MHSRNEPKMSSSPSFMAQFRPTRKLLKGHQRVESFFLINIIYTKIKDFNLPNSLLHSIQRTTLNNLVCMYVCFSNMYIQYNYFRQN